MSHDWRGHMPVDYTMGEIRAERAAHCIDVLKRLDRRLANAPRFTHLEYYTEWPSVELILVPRGMIWVYRGDSLWLMTGGKKYSSEEQYGEITDKGQSAIDRIMAAINEGVEAYEAIDNLRLIEDKTSVKQ